MFRKPHFAVAVAVVLCAVTSPLPASAAPAPLLTVGAKGNVVAGPDRLPADLPVPNAAFTRPAPALATSAAAKKKAPDMSLTSVIKRMAERKWITLEQRDASLTVWRDAVKTRKTLGGSVGWALGDAIDQLSGMAHRGSVTPSRLNIVTLTAKRNTEFFSKGVMPKPKQRVKFEGSDLVWQYYPGQGLQLQELASFGVANGLWRVKLKGHLKALLDELVSLRSKRAGGSAWEYLFSFGGGTPPWASGMTQATAVQALSRGSQLLGDPSYARIARSGLPLFDRPSPSGVKANTSKGPWYLMYSFDPGLRILNGFLQSLIGLDEMRALTGDTVADRLFKQADPVAQDAVPRYRSLGWSYYTVGNWDTFDYHELTTGFLEELCRRTNQNIYCSNGVAFRGFLDNPARVSITTRNLKNGISGNFIFWVSKPAQVSFTVKTQAGKTVLSDSAWVSPGTHTWTIHTPASKGPLDATLSSDDGHGHTSSTQATIALH